jgi:hypothetical protein
MYLSRTRPKQREMSVKMESRIAAEPTVCRRDGLRKESRPLRGVAAAFGGGADCRSPGTTVVSGTASATGGPNGSEAVTGGVVRFGFEAGGTPLVFHSGWHF